MIILFSIRFMIILTLNEYSLGYLKKESANLRSQFPVSKRKIISNLRINLSKDNSMFGWKKKSSR